MAYLNLRERRIEAKIAYVGPELAGKATNLARLRQPGVDARIQRVDDTPSAEGGLLSIAWRPRDDDRFRDCAVQVEVVSQRGATSSERFRDVVRNTDAIVFVADAHPAAQERNRASLAVVREVLGEDGARVVPLVVQVNKTDLDEALSAEVILGQLQASSLQHVTACATDGRGVVDTVEAALTAIFESIQTEGDVTTTSPRETVQPGAPTRSSKTPPDPRDGAHPLLAALRQVLRDTAHEQADDLETRVTQRLHDSLARIERRVIAMETTASELRAQVESSSGGGAPPAAEPSTTEPLLRSIEARLEELGGSVAGAASKNDLSLVTMGFDRLRDELKAEVARAVDARAKADREQITAATTALKKAVEGVSLEVRSIDVRARLTQLADQLKEVTQATARIGERVDGAAEAARGVVPRLAQGEVADKQRDVRLHEALDAIQDDMAATLAAMDEKVQEVHRKVNELIEEMKKPKKGWFS